MKGFFVIACKFIARGTHINIPAPAPANDYQILKKGRINFFREMTIPITIGLSPQDPLYAEKVSLVGQKYALRQFMISEKFNSDQFMNLIFYLRYFMFTGTKE